MCQGKRRSLAVRFAFVSTIVTADVHDGPSSLLELPDELYLIVYELETNVHSFILLAIRSHYFCCVLLVVLDTECCAFV